MINEAKNKSESEKRSGKYYGALTAKYHPDNQKTGDKKKMVKINSIRGNEKALERMYNELIGKNSAGEKSSRSSNYGFKPTNNI